MCRSPTIHQLLRQFQPGVALGRLLVILLLHGLNAGGIRLSFAFVWQDGELTNKVVAGAGYTWPYKQWTNVCPGYTRQLWCTNVSKCCVHLCTMIMQNGLADWEEVVKWYQEQSEQMVRAFNGHIKPYKLLQTRSIHRRNYFTSCDPHHDIYTFCYWQIFWHSIWHTFWHII